MASAGAKRERSDAEGEKDLSSTANGDGAKSAHSNGSGGGRRTAGPLDRPRPAPAAANHQSLQSPVRGDAYFRDLYRTEIDFRQMARRDPEFAEVLKPTGQLDFTVPAAVMQLTKTTLKLDFGLRIELPDDRLCPPVKNRHNYILWLKSLLDSSSYDPPGDKLTGLDIGTGASCIYPLLGCTQRPWDFIATDTDEKSLSYASRNIALNGLTHRIHLVPRPSSSSPLVPLDELNLDKIDFVMTNPPFYSSSSEMYSLSLKKSRPPSSACSGSPGEMVYSDGGEVGFVRRILAESRILGNRVRWYTAMLGKLSSLEELVAELRGGGVGVDNYAVTEFVQGSRTRRWGLAWSWDDMRPSPEASRGMEGLSWNKKLLPTLGEVEVGRCAVDEAGRMGESVDQLMRGLELVDWYWEREMLRGVARTRGNVWGRAWRRLKARQARGEVETGGSDGVTGTTVDKPISGFMVSIVVGKEHATIFCRWREGHDEGLFDSFCGFLRGRLELNGRSPE